MAQNALGAAFRDPRFPAMTAAEWPQCRVEVSLLSTPKPLRFADEADLLAQIEAGEDGLILEAEGKRGTFLPQVWEDLPEKRAFLAHLLKKAGLPDRHAAHALQGLALPGGQVEGMSKAMTASHPGRWWHTLPDGRVQCDLCPRDCKLHEGQRGLCFVRKMEQGRMVLTTYGRSSGFCVDPVEKKPLNHFYPGTAILSFGTAGCNLACKFCQNWDISKSREMDRLQDAGDARGDRRARRCDLRLQVGRVHLQRPGDLRRVRDGHRRRLPRAGRADRGGHRGLHPCRAAPRVLREDGRGQRRPERLHRRLLLQDLRRRACSRCSTRWSTW